MNPQLISPEQVLDFRYLQAAGPEEANMIRLLEGQHPDAPMTICCTRESGEAVSFAASKQLVSELTGDLRNWVSVPGPRISFLRYVEIVDDFPGAQASQVEKYKPGVSG